MSAGTGLNQVFKAVKQFHKFGNHPIGPKKNKPIEMLPTNNRQTVIYSGYLRDLSESLGTSPSSRLLLRVSWMLEEIAELLEADTLRDQIDSVLDLIYFAIGTLVEIGFYPGRAFEAVHAANMRKVPSVDGSKVVKPAGWVGPDAEIDQEIARQQHGVGV